MKINYWHCPFREYEETGCDWDEEGNEIDHTSYYGCTNEKNETGSCPVDNKRAGREEDCELLNEEDPDD